MLSYAFTFYAINSVVQLLNNIECKKWLPSIPGKIYFLKIFIILNVFYNLILDVFRHSFGLLVFFEAIGALEIAGSGRNYYNSGFFLRVGSSVKLNKLTEIIRIQV